MKGHEGITWRPDKTGRKWPYARVPYTDSQGRRRYIERKGRNLSHAKELRHQLLAELAESGPEAIAADKMTFAELARMFEAAKLVEPVYAGNTRVSGMRTWRRQKGFLKSLVEYFGPRLFKQITYEDLLGYRQTRFATPTRRGGHRSVSHVNRELSLLRSIFNFARRMNLINRSPFDQGPGLISIADEARRDRTLSPAEEVRLLEACSGRRAHLYYIVVAALDTGMRKGELLQLLWSDIDFDAGIIIVRSTTTKTRRGRIIGLTARLKESLLLWQELSESSDLVFNGIKDIKKAFTTACKKAKIEDLKFHDLRHTATTRMVEAGILPAQVMKATGHTQYATFSRYVNPDGDSAARSAALLDDHNKRISDRVAEALGDEIHHPSSEMVQ